MDTIFALASAPGRAGVAVIRVSGPEAARAVERLTGRSPPPPRRATRRRIRSSDGETIDEGLVVWFPGPASFTGEDVAEFHVHGGRAVVAGALEALADGPGSRLAEPGEFTRRAFENGKVDLTAAEGLADLVAAETAAQRRQALRQTQGELGRVYESWRARLVGALAHSEAGLDFADEDLPDGVEAGARAEVVGLVAEIERHLDDGGRGERLRDGLRLAIVGPPNAGKSSLLNALARREAAIVSRHPGTTRDVIEVPLDLGGYPVVVADTAGLREATEEVEREGVRRGRRWADEADLRIALFDGARWPERDRMTAALVDARTIVAVGKSDLGRASPPLEVAGRPAFAVSARTGEGLAELVDGVRAWLAERYEGAAAPALTRLRHRTALRECRDALRRFLDGGADELRAEDLRLAARALGRITGRVDVEDVLDVVFRDFCIGK